MSLFAPRHRESIAAAERFARERLAPWAAGRPDSLPPELWRAAGEAGLLGIAVPREYGGRGLDYLAVTAVAAVLTGAGHNPGFCLSWIIHNVVTRLAFWELAREDQHARFLPDLAVGRSSASISISEAGVGAHPKHLQTRAVRRGDEFVIQGEKSFLTNGPFADLYVALAITGFRGERKEFSALIVPRGTPGAALTPPLELDCFRPSPHCGLRLRDCSVPAANLLGPEGEAYGALAMAFREREDIVLAGLALGGMDRQLGLVIEALRAAGGTAGKETEGRLGRLRYLRDALRLLAFTAASSLDAAGDPEERLSLVLSFRDLARAFQEELVALVPPSLAENGEEYHLLTGDVSRTIGLAGNVLALRRRKHGAALLASREDAF
ncbi:MAG: acyl-CoA dehydrogenase family protein [Pseudomonadota bacterium]|nr:acyl-CoA dehydrogenase family protein [Pseudomonadota bacterium]